MPMRKNLGEANSHCQAADEPQASPVISKIFSVTACSIGDNVKIRGNGKRYRNSARIAI